MNPPRFRRFVHLGLFAMGLVLRPCLPVCAAPNPPAATRDAGTSRVKFGGSLAPLPVVAGATTAAAASRTVTRIDTLTAEQLAAPLEFSVALGMRNLAEFQSRVASGELVPYEEVQARYLPLQSDYDRVAAWLRSEGFTLTFTDTSRLSVFVWGTVAQVQSSFQVTMQSMTVDGVAYPGAATAPSLPASVSGGVLGINGLQPYIRKHPHHVANVAGAQTDANIAPPYHINDIRNAYNGLSLTATVNGTAKTLDGTGQTIAIVINAFALHTDLTTFWSNNGVPQSLDNIEEVNPPGGATGNREVEETLDESWTSGIAPGVKVRVYCSDTLSDYNIDKCYAQIQADVTGKTAADIAQPGLHALSLSFGEDESGPNGISPSEYTTEAGYFAAIANGNPFYGGVSIFVSSGDSGSQPDEKTSASLIVSYPAADVSVTGVGGTDLYDAPGNAGRTWNEVGWSGSGGGAASSQIPQPAWQTGTGVSTAGGTRLVPDVASVGGPTPADLEYNGQDGAVYGTSWSAPTWAGFSALLNQARVLQGRLPLGFLDVRLYPLILTGNFYDITSGNNSYSGSGSYSAGTGYDEVTGIGTPDLSVLVNSVLGPTISGFTPTSGAAGASVAITGTNFYTNPASPLTVSFNGTAAAYTINSSTQITATVPMNVTAGPISVTALGDVATSSANFTLPAPDARITVSHTGAISEDDNGDAFTLAVANVGTASTSGTVTVTATPASGLYIAALSGAGWTCSGGSNGVWTCTRADALAAGSSYPALTASVNVSPNATTSQSGSFTGQVACPGDTDSANDSSTDTFSIQTVASTPTQQWRYSYFHTTADAGVAADTANPAGDGINNLLKYALGLDPTTVETSPVTSDVSTGYLRLTAPKNPNATDVTYSVQVNGDLTNTAGWTTSGTTILQNTATTLQVQDNTPVTGAARQFIRLEVTR